MTDDRCPVQIPGAVVSGRGSRPVLTLGGHSLGLNETALAIWDLCDGRTSVEEMVVAVVELAGIDPGRARMDVSGVVDELGRLGLVEFAGRP